jgi:hypothetical protein
VVLVGVWVVRGWVVVIVRASMGAGGGVKSVDVPASPLCSKWGRGPYPRVNGGGGKGDVPNYPSRPCGTHADIVRIEPVVLCSGKGHVSSLTRGVTRTDGRSLLCMEWRCGDRPKGQVALTSDRGNRFPPPTPTRVQRVQLFLPSRPPPFFFSPPVHICVNRTHKSWGTVRPR